MNSAELIEKLKAVLTDIDWNLDQFTDLHEISPEIIEKYVNDTRFPSSKEEFANDEKVIAAVGKIKRVQAERVGCDFDQMEYVFHFTDHDIYLAIAGSYNSWSGVEFYDKNWYEVKPRQITTTIYERQK